jgi:hypothetical protein
VSVCGIAMRCCDIFLESFNAIRVCEYGRFFFVRFEVFFAAMMAK